MKQEVILLDVGWDPTKYVAVGLRNAGCSVHIVTTAGSGERLDAKYLGRGITREAAPLLHSDGYIGAVESILASRPSASVLALTEDILYRIWDAAPAWIDRISPHCQPWQRALLRDKAQMSDYVARAGVRIPEQRRISMADDSGAAIAREVIREFGFPLVVKGTTGCGGARVRIVHTAQDALDALTAMARSGECFLQEFVAGRTFVVGGLFRGGRPIRIHAWEPIERAHATGPSLRHRSEGDPALLEFALGAFRALDWTGLAFMEGIQRPDGACFFIELNPRPWGSTAATARAGVDLFGPLACLLSGRMTAPDASFIAGKRTTLFPQAAKARLRKGGVRALASLAREPHLWLDAPWSDPGLVAHLGRQLWWTWRDGTLKRRAIRPHREGRGSFDVTSAEAPEK